MLWEERTMSFRMLRGVPLVLLEKRWLVIYRGRGMGGQLVFFNGEWQRKRIEYVLGGREVLLCERFCGGYEWGKTGLGTYIYS
jgi:hypothetical protein